MKWTEMVAAIGVIATVVAATAGYIMNIATLLSDDPMSTGELIVRAVGLFIMPVGAVVGYF